MTNQEIELYFIQLCFIKQRVLLTKQYRKLYDTMLDKYMEIYKDGKSKGMDLGDINKKFLKIFN
jgi:hypothetical protein